MKEKLKKIILKEGYFNLCKNKNVQSKKSFSFKSNNYSVQDRNNFSLDNKILKKKSIDMKISYIGDIKNEFGIYSNKLSKIENAAKNFEKLKHKIKIMKKMKFQNRFLRKLDCKFQEENILNFDVKDCLRDYDKIYFKTNKPIFEKIKQKEIENKKNKLIRECSTYLINFNNRKKNKYLSTNINFFNNNKNSIKKQKLILSPTKKFPVNKRNNGNICNINSIFTYSDSYLNKTKISSNSNSSNNIKNYIFSDMLKVKKISNTELSEIQTRLYGGKLLKNSEKNLKEKYNSFKKILDLTYSRQNNNKKRDMWTNTSSQNNGKIDCINIHLKTKNKFRINSFYKKPNNENIIQKYNDDINLIDYKDMWNSSSSSEMDNKK